MRPLPRCDARLVVRNVSPERSGRALRHAFEHGARIRKIVSGSSDRHRVVILPTPTAPNRFLCNGLPISCEPAAELHA